MLPFNKRPDGINKKTLGKLNEEKVKVNIWEYAVGFGGTTSERLKRLERSMGGEPAQEIEVLG
jgi:hypothetical protein